MRAALAFLCIGCCPGQQRPELGWFVDRAGALRPLEGVAGAPLTSAPVARGVRAHARGPGWLAWTAGEEFCLLAEDSAAPSCRSLDARFELLRFTPKGFPLRAWDGARFHELASPGDGWRERLTCPSVDGALLDFELDTGGAMRLLLETPAGLSIVRFSAEGVWLTAEHLQGVRAPALLEPGGWVAAADKGLAGPGGWRWEGPAPGALRPAWHGLWIAWDEEGPALLLPARRQSSRIPEEAPR